MVARSYFVRVKISIIVATHERPASLARLLCSLTPQLARGRHELFIAENGTPAPAQIAVAGIELTHLHDARPGKCRIQNRAIFEVPQILAGILEAAKPVRLQVARSAGEDVAAGKVALSGAGAMNSG